MLNTVMKILGWITVALMAVIIVLAVTGLSRIGIFKTVMDVSLQAMHAAFVITAVYFSVLTAKRKKWIFFSLVLAALAAFAASFVMLFFNVRFPMPALLAFDGYVLLLYIALLTGPVNRSVK